MPKDAKGHGSNARGASAAHQNGVQQVGRPLTLSPKVTDTVRQNPNGFSIQPNGRQPTGGYMVSIPGHTQIVDSDKVNPALVHAYAQAHADALSQPGAHIGGWSNGGKTYLDVSQNIRDKSAAVAAGRQRNQIAIWDVGRSAEIKTGGTGRDFADRRKHYLVNQ